MSCISCCEDITSENIVKHIYVTNAFKERVTESLFCNDCTVYLLNNILPNLIKSIINETCEVSLKRLMSMPLPTNLTSDGTGRGIIIDKITINGQTQSAILNDDIFNGEINKVNEEMKVIYNHMNIEGYSYIDTIKILFGKYI